MDSNQANIPPIKDLTVENITENTIMVNSQGDNERLIYVMERLVTHLHAFARETRLSTKELMAGLDFLEKVGKISSDSRREFILLTDVLGLSLLVDGIDHPKPPASTEGSIFGPAHTHDAEVMASGGKMCHDPKGDPCIIVCTIKDRSGKPIPGVQVDIWETDSTGHYDVQHDDRDGPDGRCIMKSDSKGEFWFKAVVPARYKIPEDGPVGQLLESLKRHSWRPAHIHFMFQKAGWDNLITALYLRGDPYESSDPVFGVKQSLVVDFEPATPDIAKKYSVAEGSKVLQYNFVLVSDKETEELRDKNALEALRALGMKVKLVDHLPVPDLD
ncbi:hypothetical protein EYC80_006887 [Monilinia laxa]|uniref:Intradiol ring-cleavage dioxygenases domain-containing protein n=1 Tax=Monilinia laxa TaxID=61186 RepID=A0A5N6JZX4_MONLA|nr:hypothetical protein EYC80_006887 [Monilinia laxa]